MFQNFHFFKDWTGLLAACANTIESVIGYTVIALRWFIFQIGR